MDSGPDRISPVDKRPGRVARSYAGRGHSGVPADGTEQRDETPAREHSRRAERHHATAERLFRGRDELAAVAFFYAAMHRVQAALVRDPDAALHVRRQYQRAGLRA